MCTSNIIISKNFIIYYDFIKVGNIFWIGQYIMCMFLFFLLTILEYKRKYNIFYTKFFFFFNCAFKYKTSYIVLYTYLWYVSKYIELPVFSYRATAAVPIYLATIIRIYLLFII